MEKWLDDNILLFLNWHGPDDDPNPDDAGGPDGSTEDPDPNDNKDDPKDKDDDKTKDKKTDDASKKKGKDDEPDPIPENIESLSADELRDLLRVIGKDLKKTRGIARKRLHEIMEKKDKFKQIEEEKESERVKALEEKEEFKKLYGELKPKYDILVKEVGKTVEHFEVEYEKLKEDLPEEYHNLIPNVDVRERIAWIRNFKKTVVAKQKQNAANDTSAKKQKADTNIGDKGNPPDDDKTKVSTKSTIEEQINKCTSPEELENLVESLGKKGL